MEKFVLLNKIRSNPFQPIINFEEEVINKQIEQLEKDSFELIVKEVDDFYEVIIGEDILSAAKKINLSEIKVKVIDLNQGNPIKTSYLEKLTPIEEAIVYLHIMHDTKQTQAELAKSLKKTQSTIANKIRLLNLQQEIQDGLTSKKISERHGRSLLVLEGEQQLRAFEHILKKKLNVRLSEEYIYELLHRKKQQKKYLTKGFTRNIQVGLNSINQCIDMIKQLGIEVYKNSDETEDEVVVTITLPK